jgi:hypothetical protein
VLLAAAIRAAIPITAARAGIALPEPEDNEISAAIEQIETMQFEGKKVKPALERARALSAEHDTPENKLLMASLLRTAFEDSLAGFVIRRKCPLPYSSKWDEVATSKLWEAAKQHQRLQEPAAHPLVTAIDLSDNKPILFDELEPASLYSINWEVFRALLNTLEAITPNITYSFQTKLDRL